MLICWNRDHFPLRNLLLNPLMWSRLIEILNVGTQDTIQLLLMQDYHVVKALSPNTPQKSFTDRIGARRVIRRFEYLDVASCCNTNETVSKLAIIIANEIPGGLSIRGCLP
jgi:hypothetical protein